MDKVLGKDQSSRPTGSAYKFRVSFAFNLDKNRSTNGVGVGWLQTW